MFIGSSKIRMRLILTLDVCDADIYMLFAWRVNDDARGGNGCLSSRNLNVIGTSYRRREYIIRLDKRGNSCDYFEWKFAAVASILFHILAILLHLLYACIHIYRVLY